MSAAYRLNITRFALDAAMLFSDILVIPFGGQFRGKAKIEKILGSLANSPVFQQIPACWSHHHASSAPKCPRKTLGFTLDSLKALDPNVWTRRALQGKIVRLESVVSHQCIRPRIGADAPGHHVNPRTFELITGHASKGYLGSSVLGCAGKTICPSTLFSRRTLVGRLKGAFTLGLPLL
jgi:hypothetical protein